MAELTLRQALLWTGGQLWQPADPEHWFPGITTDSRSVSSGELFVALSGERFDGHDFLAAAVSAGAGGVLVSDVCAVEKAALPGQTPVILVADTVQALLDLAGGWRDTLTAPVIAVTGSVGKTSTRQLVAAGLAASLRVHQTEANLNNEIGLPLTMLKAKPTDQAIVVEFGMRGRGEIERLSLAAKPDIALITGIGWSHIGRLGSREAIFAAKSEIQAGLKTDGLLMLNADDPYLIRLAEELLRRPLPRPRLALIAADQATIPARLTSAAQVIVSATAIRTADDQVSFVAHCVVQPSAASTDGSGASVDVPIQLASPGRHQVRNALFGLACACVLGVPAELAARGMAGSQTVGSRQRLLRRHELVILDDTYNAAPESMVAALETLADLAAGTSGRRIAALGCMLELGDFAAQAHQEVGQAAARCGCDLLLVLGPNAEDLLLGARQIRPGLPSCLCTDSTDMAERLLAAVRPGDAILVKGSRAFALERVVAELLRKPTEFAEEIT